MKNKIIKDALALTLITLVAGVALGGVYEITKDPIAKQEAQAKAEAYEQVFTDAAAFEAVEMDDTLTKTIRDQLDQEGYKAQSIEEVMRAEDQSGETLGYAFTVVTSEGYGGDIQFSMGVQNDGTLNGISILSIGETAGLGMNADTPAFKDQFVGKQGESHLCADAWYVSYTGSYHICKKWFWYGYDDNGDSCPVQPDDLDAPENDSGQRAYAGLYRSRCILCNYRTVLITGIYSESLRFSGNLHSADRS